MLSTPRAAVTLTSPGTREQSLAALHQQAEKEIWLHLPQHEAQTIGVSPANTRHKGPKVRRGRGVAAPLPGLAVAPSFRCHTGMVAAIRARAVLIWGLFIHSLQ